MRFIAHLLFSLLLRVVMIVWDAHVTIFWRNLFGRHPDAGRPRQVKRG